jgi:hypothetical protein
MPSFDADKAQATAKSGTGSFMPFAIGFPMLIIAFMGCVGDGGCQGALNAQSEAVHIALEAGGWIDGGE